MIPIVRLVYPVLETTPQRWIQLASMLPPELFQRKPAVNEWSAYDCLLHIVDTERSVFPARVGYLLRGEDFPAYHPGKEGEGPKGDPTPVELAGEFARLRAESLDLLSKVGEGDLNRAARHQELGMVTLGEMIHEWAGHDLMHTVQGERALLQPFIDGCGPWKRYFSDHVVPPSTPGGR
ncbi:MAG TPA: DinB family protein [Candidatus Methylomirabilis sp.]|nr:DinB family protein [Candidatus Methylomirabilis sp.]